MPNQFYLTSKLPPYIFAAIADIKQKAVAKGLDLIDFGMGNPDSAPPDHVMKSLNQLTQDPKLYGYSVSGGIHDLRKAICGYYQRVFNVELDYKTQALVTIGSKEGITSLATAISDSETHICVKSPSYPIHTFAFIISRSNTHQIPAENAYEFLAKFKEHALQNKGKVRAVIVNYPCNPTAETVDIDFYEELVDFCRQQKIYIISDIAYAELYFDEKTKPNSILQVKGASDIAIEFCSTSKSYSMAGCRVGFVVGNKDLIAALYKIKSYLDYSSFTPLQMASIEALSNKSDKYLKNLRKLYDERGNYFIAQAKKELNWSIKKPQASMFLWSKLPENFNNLSSFDFCKKLIEEIGVVFCPGSSFGISGEGFVRISVIHNNQKTDEAISRIKNLAN